MNEGTIILHDGVTGHTLIGQNPLASHSDVPSAMDDNQNVFVGYLAYPNPTLKNDIPDSLFYEYESLENWKIVSRGETPLRGGNLETSFLTSGKLEQSVTKAQYIQKIKQIKELLAAGEIYQLVFAVRFRKKFEGDPYALFLKLNEVNPAEFSAYLNCEDFQIISMSPERFFQVKDGKITTEPIKGTIQKQSAVSSEVNSESELTSDSQQSAFDPNLKKLLESEKERAELDMITDLERNDVGKICKYGTLKVREKRGVKELPNLWHCYSVVEGELEDNTSPADVLNAMFPGGSVTGCPKKRAMKYIEELEGMPRNIFTGSIGYISGGGPFVDRSWTNNDQSNRATIGSPSIHNRNLDFNIAIRTALVRDGYIEYWAGGGIVADSVPEKEYEEVVLKAERFLGII